jgi:RNA polymerase sigma factor (TIGR02999 family)
MSEVTRILSAVEQGGPQAPEQFLPRVYDELRKLAAQRLAHGKPGQTLDATALVHEAYLRLFGPGDSPSVKFANRSHFLAAAAQAMRRILVDRVRARHSLKRGGDAQRIPLDGIAANDSDQQLLALDEALSQLKWSDPLAACVFELHQFGGMPHEQVAVALETSVYHARQNGRLPAPG